MTQSQLLNKGEMKNGDNTRKRLKITQDMKALITNLLKIWGLEKRVTGMDLGLGKFQFVFETEEEIEGVLKLQPYHFDYWMLSLARWQSKKSPQFPSEITFWVRVLGVPAEFRTAPTYESIGDAIGRTVMLDVEHARVQVVVDAFKGLCFETTIDFKGGEFYASEEALVSLRYEKFFGFCDFCSSLCHKDEKCPLDPKNIKTSPEKSREMREGNGGWHEVGKHDERSWSYKGVVINGNINQPNRERERVELILGRGRAKQRRGVIREPPHTMGIPVGTQKVCIEDHHEERKQLVRHRRCAFKHLQDMWKGKMGRMRYRRVYRKIQSLVVNDRASEGEEEDVMEMDEFQAALMEHGLDTQAIDALPVVSEEELEEMMAGYEEDDQLQEAGDQTNGAEEKNKEAIEQAQKQGPRKRLFKPSINVAGSTEMKNAVALVSPRKRATPKMGTRKGDTNKQLESKGSSNLNSGNLKN
ncbi:hypothetical protein Bca52824_056473 [Brassica carinata]|uniref:DUF4283 domain-containing protein n=1 Tax=Brassica carinata TaxID=52824 RepID=A0A8X7QUG1_BRACI|nr:hypothetical protein Bca52824_056473 [Brassica carinata]